ncbi:response regulator transcription factor [Olivibacter sp. SDN3]|uniref:LytR/AlgR family response regulator transcription factor n=1 Tax=Olivibacter sp. SDN3 TaxID=2764720 RepID=UPI0016510E6A|nr:LytTR family DNA-binding domain-containing protein [Olivibacter sp. SDN3]QNL48071.1 response regulator transcription factor [Olivibacter sp. SDN3]
MIDCIIIDDEQYAVDLLEHYIGQVPDLHLVAATTDPLAGLALLNEMQQGLVFLDVQMPDLTGVEILKLINKKDIRVIMTTAYKEYALDGFEHEVVDYLLKPIGFPRFLKAVNRLVESHRTQQPADNGTDDFLFVKTEQKGKFLKVNIQHIAYIEGLGNYVVIHTDTQQRITTYLNLRDLVDRLLDKGFIRIHKSFIVSLAHLTAVEGNAVKVLNDDRPIPIGKAYKQEFFKLVNTKLLSFLPKKP